MGHLSAKLPCHLLPVTTLPISSREPAFPTITWVKSTPLHPSTLREACDPALASEKTTSPGLSDCFKDEWTCGPGQANLGQTWNRCEKEALTFSWYGKANTLYIRSCWETPMKQTSLQRRCREKKNREGRWRESRWPMWAPRSRPKWSRCATELLVSWAPTFLFVLKQFELSFLPFATFKSRDGCTFQSLVLLRHSRQGWRRGQGPHPNSSRTLQPKCFWDKDGSLWPSGATHQTWEVRARECYIRQLSKLHSPAHHSPTTPYCI